MYKETTGKHHLVACDSLNEFVEYSRTLEDHFTSQMPNDTFFGVGIESMSQVHDMAATGLPREGITAIMLATEALQSLDRDEDAQQFATFFDFEGCEPDIARYLDGEPECMVNHFMRAETRQQPIICLVVNMAVNSSITADAFTKQGRALVALAEAVDQAGLQAEIWADATIDGRDGYSGRYKILLKAPGQFFDLGAFMYALTAPAFFRALMLNAMYDWPRKWQAPMSVGVGHGHAVHEFKYRDDYPADAIYIPAMRSNSDAGKHVTVVLKELGLLA